VRQDYLEGKVQIGGVKTTANPSDILTKFLPAPTHQEHSKYLNLTPTKPYTQNGNLSGTTTILPHPNVPANATSLDCVMTKSARARIDSDGNCSRQIPTKHNTFTNDKKQKQRQRYWNSIHTLRRQNPHLSINPKQTLTSSVAEKPIQRPILRLPTKTKQTFHRQSAHHRRTQITALAHETPVYRHDPAFIYANRKHAKLQARRPQQPLQNHHVRITTANHDLQTTKAFSNKQQQRIKKWIDKLSHTRTTHEAQTRRTHPFCHHHQDPFHASTSRTPCKYKKTIYTKTPSTRKKEIRTKMTDRQNTYNFSHTQPKQTRSKLFDPQHRGQHDNHKRHPKFNRQPLSRLRAPQDPSRGLPAKTMKSKKRSGEGSPTNPPITTF
jgi:hypothetical protein